MDQSFISHISQNINVTILPIIVIPVIGLSCLVFYNRLAAINTLIHSLYKDLRELYLKPETEIEKAKHADLIKTIKLEQDRLLRRSNLIRCAIVTCFSGLIAFVLSAITMILSLFCSSIMFGTLALWLLGAICFVIGISLGIFEIRNPALRNIALEGALFEQWEN